MTPRNLLLLTSPAWLAWIIVKFAEAIHPHLDKAGQDTLVDILRTLAGWCAIPVVIILGLYLLPGILYGMIGGSPVGGFWLGVLSRWWRRR